MGHLGSDAVLAHASVLTVFILRGNFDNGGYDMFLELEIAAGGVLGGGIKRMRRDAADARMFLGQRQMLLSIEE